MRSENLQDISSLGGNPAYIGVAVLFWLLGNADLAYRLAAALALCYLATTLLRIAFFRERPDRQKYKNLLERIDASSFPSLHSMRAAVWATTTAMFFNQPVVWLLAAAMSIAVAATRVMLGRHHRSDAAAGLVIGVFIALVSVSLIPGYWFS